VAYTLFEEFEPSDVEDFRSLKGKPGPVERGLFIAESGKIARKILASKLEVRHAYMTREFFADLQPLFDKRTDATNIFLASKEEMEQVIGYHLHQGIMIAARIPESRSIEEAAQSWKEPFTVVVLDSIADAENMGGIIRNAAALGARAVIVDDQSCNPYLRRSVRVSMGTIVDVEIIQVANLVKALRTLGELRSVRRIGAALTNNSVDLSDLKPDGNTVLVFGSEGWGLRQEVMDTCDVLAKIPISESVDSLNVGVASGIFLWWARQGLKTSGALPPN